MFYLALHSARAYDPDVDPSRTAGPSLGVQ
jgi:hypothetical protein